jgi:hypothetical protein
MWIDAGDPMRVDSGYAMRVDPRYPVGIDARDALRFHARRGATAAIGGCRHRAWHNQTGGPDEEGQGRNYRVRSRFQEDAPFLMTSLAMYS